jgi:hypothetical protein
MTFLKYASAVAVLALASPAEATSYAWCQMSGTTVTDGREDNHLSGIVEIEDGEEAWLAFVDGPFGKGFREYVRSAIDRNAYSLDCKKEDSLRDAKERIELVTSANSERMSFHQTGWLGGRAAAVEQAQTKPRARERDLILTMPGQKSSPAKRTNSAAAKQQWEIDYEHKMEVYRQELAKQQQAVSEYEREKAATERMRAEARSKAEKAQAEWRAAVAACQAGDHAKCSGATQQ